MGKYMKTCRVCGALYEGCSAARKADGIFRWQEVACSPECGEKYLAAVNASRGKSPVAEPSAQHTMIAPGPDESEAVEPPKVDADEAQAEA